MASTRLRIGLVNVMSNNEELLSWLKLVQKSWGIGPEVEYECMARIPAGHHGDTYTKHDLARADAMAIWGG